MQPLNTKQNENRPPKSTHTFTFSTFLSFIETSQTSFMMCQESTSCLCELFWAQQFDNLIIAMTMQIEFCNEGRIIHTNQTWQPAWVDGKMCLSTEWFIDFSIYNSFFHSDKPTAKDTGYTIQRPAIKNNTWYNILVVFFKSWIIELILNSLDILYFKNQWIDLDENLFLLSTHSFKSSQRRQYSFWFLNAQKRISVTNVTIYGYIFQ